MDSDIKFILFGPYEGLDDEERFEQEQIDKLRMEIQDEKLEYER